MILAFSLTLSMYTVLQIDPAGRLVKRLAIVGKSHALVDNMLRREDNFVFELFFYTYTKR